MPPQRPRLVNWGTNRGVNAASYIVNTINYNVMATKNSYSITVNEKPLSNGRKHLFLTIYHDGKRTREYLKGLYIVKGTTAKVREANRQAKEMAEAIRAKRLIELQTGTYGIENKFKEDTPFLEYYRKVAESRRGKESLGNWGVWYSCLKHLEKYCTEQTTFRDITKEWLEGFKDYLNKAYKDQYKQKYKGAAEGQPLSQNTKSSYFNKVRACMNQAFEDRIIPINPMRGVAAIRAEETERVYLTLDEVRKLVKTPCMYPVIKRSFLFSCLTGIRKCDLDRLTWSEIRKNGDFTQVVFKQKKTGGQEYLDIPKQAEEYLGERGKPEQRVFAGFRYTSQTLLELKRWCIAAGITKPVTFHSARHTFAVMMLNDAGADIYTVSKLLGHKDLTTTQIYAKIVDKRKQDAVNNLPDIKL